MCCGAAGEHRVPKTFLLRELNLGRGVQFAEVVAARAIHGLATAPRIRLLTSFCDAHRHYWRIRFALLFGGLIGLFALAIPGIIFAVIMITVVRTESRLPDALVFLTVAGYLAVWIPPATW